MTDLKTKLYQMFILGTDGDGYKKAFSNGYRLQYDQKFQQKVLDNHKKKIKFEMI